MKDKPSIIFSYSIDGNGKGKELQGKEISALIASKKLAWVHLNANHPDTRKWLEKEVAYLDHIILDALLADETRPRILEFDKGVMLILRGVNMNDADHPEDMVSLRIWIDPSRIITVVRREVKAANDIRQKIIDGTGPKNAADFLTALTTRLFERIDPVITELDEDTDNIEESIMESPDVNIRHDINEVRKKAIMLRRYIAPQREVITRLRTCELKWLDQIHRRYFQENLDRLTRYTEDLDAIRERAQIVKDELTNILSDRLNKNMYILSIVAAIFLPLGFFTGLLGINVGGIPGADNEYAFYIFCTTLTIIVILQIWIFRKLKWI